MSLCVCVCVSVCCYIMCVYLCTSTLCSFSRFLSIDLLEAYMTIGLIVLLLESALIQLFQTVSAHEMIRMEFLEHRRNTASGNGLGAASTQWATLGVIMSFAIGQALVIEEGATLEGLTAVLQKKKWKFNNRIFPYIKYFI